MNFLAVVTGDVEFYNVKTSIRDMRYAICDMRYAICDMRYAICDMRYAIIGGIIKGLYEAKIEIIF